LFFIDKIQNTSVYLSGSVFITIFTAPKTYFLTKAGIILLLLQLILFSSCPSYAQSNPKIDSVISSYIGQLTAIWDSHNKETFNELLNDHSQKPTNVTASSRLVIANKRSELLLRRNFLQQRIYKKDVGLNFTAGYQRNSSAPFVDQEDVVVFRQKAQFGLDWDLLKGGLYDNRLKVKTLKNEVDFIKHSDFVQKNNRAFLISGEQIVANFNLKKISILQKRKELNAKQMEVIEKLWAYKHITKDDYLKAIQNKTDINGLFELYSSFSEKAMQMSIRPNDTLETPLLDVDFDKLLKKINYITQASDTSLPASLLKNAEYESKYLREIGLKAYTRYNYYDVYTQNIGNRSFVSFGLNLSMPLTFSGKEKKELYLVNKELEFQQQKLSSHSEPGVEYLLLNYYYEYRYKLKKYFNLIEKRNVFAEYVRTEKVKQEFGDLEFNPNTALFILDDYWSNAVELLDLHQDMYKILLNIKEKVPGTEINEFTFPVTIKNDVKDTSFSNPDVKAVYIWSKSLLSYTPEMVTEYCDLNDFNHLIISYKNDKQYIKQLNEFINKNYSRTISVMTGNNNLIDGKFRAFSDSLASQLPLNFVKGLHLDVEPHTLPDFKENKDAYFSKYMKLLDSAAVFCKRKNLRLSVSIPLHYPDTVLKKIFSVCDQVYLMAYENVKVEVITKKIAEEIALNKDKVVLALRTKDFESRQQMNEHFKKIGIRHTAYHDYEGLLELDKADIQIKDEGK
jgi:hypothetical protein